VFHWQETSHSGTERDNLLILLSKCGFTGSIDSLETPVVCVAFCYKRTPARQNSYSKQIDKYLLKEWGIVLQYATEEA
jgi:hypothetical protein